jgi:hypothetical protein
MDINSLNLEKFSSYGSKVSRKISITRSYSFGIPPALYKENDFDKYKYALLYYDKVANVIAFKFTEDDSEGGFKLVKYGEGERRGASFVARSFFNTYKLDPKVYKGRYEAKKATKEGIGDFYWIQLPTQSTEPGE